MPAKLSTTVWSGQRGYPDYYLRLSSSSFSFLKFLPSVACVQSATAAAGLEGSLVISRQEKIKKKKNKK